MKKVLIFGGSVFIGKAIANKFIQRGDEVYVLNRGNNPCPNGAIQLLADRNEFEQLQAVLSGKEFDIVIDGSAYKEYQTKIAVELLKNHTNHFIHISSAAVYKDSEIFPFREDSPRGTSSHWGEYSTNKYLCEEVLFNAWKEQKFPITILRPFYVYGAGNNLDRESYVFARLLNNKPIIIPGMGMPMIQFGHIDDLCDAIEKIAENKKCFGKAYNISGTEYITLKGWVEVCGRVLNITPKLVLVDTKATTYKARDWFPFRDINMIGSCDLIKKDIGFKPQYSIYDGLKQTVDKQGIEKFKNSLKESDVERKILEQLDIKYF
ncbi:SDR family oxidoreductase [Defluviitalea phaphyphila]|uniref:SDR family oxidoreductase n=1 Tax=Defluviitalea phaphyphila TaxID=1473580 RepID=UPI0007304E03|nr:SDR family oxidoreductase [Defluviitalea phaphyphila]